MITKDSDSLILKTEDGSQTLISPIFKERYHSIHGAKTESDVVFINAGLKDKNSYNHINVLEMGFGTGLNALLAWNYSINNNLKISYNGYEKVPVEKELYSQLDYTDFINNNLDIKSLHTLPWNIETQLSNNFYFLKTKDDIINVNENINYDVIFFDAFAPNAQEELWTVDMFQKMYNITSENGILVTYCAKGQVKRNMKEVGYKIEELAGPPGKREMTRARKIE